MREKEEKEHNGSGYKKKMRLRVSPAAGMKPACSIRASALPLAPLTKGGAGVDFITTLS